MRIFGLAMDINDRSKGQTIFLEMYLTIVEFLIKLRGIVFSKFWKRDENLWISDGYKRSIKRTNNIFGNVFNDS